jgi:hypothetical protein
LGELHVGKPWTELTRNVVGEMQLAVLLKKHDGKRAAAGWDGDQYVAFEGPDESLGLVWLSTWDSEDEASEFAESYAKFQTTKLGDDAEAPEGAVEKLRRKAVGKVFAMERRGTDVAVVEGFDEATTDSLIEKAFQATKAEKLQAVGKE